MKAYVFLLVIALQLATAMIVQSALELYRHKIKPYEDDGTECVLFCRVRTTDNINLTISPEVTWSRRNDLGVYELIHDFLHKNTLFHVTIKSPKHRRCTEVESEQGAYNCDLIISPCDTSKFAGHFYQCNVTSPLLSSAVSTEVELVDSSKTSFFSTCFVPVAENLTVTEIEVPGSSLSVNFTWDVTKKAPNEKYCTGSRRWDIKMSNSSTPDSFADRRPTSSSGFYSEESIAERVDTSEVFHNLSRSLYYLFEVRNKRLQRDTQANIQDILYQYASFVYYFGEQEPPSIRIPKEERKVERVNEGDLLLLSCVGVGKPAPSVSFRVPREEGYQSDFESSAPSHNTAQLTLVDIQPNNAGEYACELTTTHVNPPVGKRKFIQTKRYIVIVEPSQNQTSTSPVTTGQRCSALSQSTCNAYLLRNIDVFFNTTGDIANSNLKLLTENYMTTIQSLHNDSSDRCIPFLEAVMCHTLYPYCDRTTGTPSPRPICKSACDVFSADGPCGHLLRNEPRLYDVLSSRCDTRVTPAGTTPECIHISVDYPKNQEERIRKSWCSNGNGRNYEGEVAHTRNGHQCQSWLLMNPHTHPLSSAEFPYELTNARHYCRNPGGLGEQPWCYTTDTSIRWEYCDVPQCDVCEQYSGEFCRDLPFYNTSSAHVFYQRESIQFAEYIEDILESRMRLVFEQLDGSNLAGGCQLALRQLLCHSVVPLCKMQVDSAPKDTCSDHCHLVEVLSHCLQVDITEYMKRINYPLTLPRCPGTPEVESEMECAPSPIRIPPPQDNSTEDCYIVADYGYSYTGNVSITESGHTCIAWEFNSPLTHMFNVTEYPELIDTENFCRNPGQVLSKPWCFTNASSLTWEYCDVPFCVELDATTKPSTVSTVAAEPQSNNNHISTVIPVVITVVFGATLLVIAVLVSNCVCYAFRKKASKLKSNTPISPTLEQYRIDSGQSEIKFTFNDQYILTQAMVSKVAETIKTFQQYDRNNIKYIKQIGQGNFGIVYLGQAVDLVDGEEETLVAVKTLKEETAHESLEEFVREAKIMLSFDHPNITKLHGVCMQDLPYCLIFEYMNRGDLANFLRENASSVQRRFMSCDRPRSRTESTLSDDPPSLDTEQLTDICKQVAAGMEYLSMRNHVHRDLACRNCLVKMEETMDNDGEVTTLGNIIIKIGDFGMSHNLYTHNYYRVRGQAILPVRWMAPESIIYGKFTTAADVWSFGVTMWEVFSFGLQPYYGTSNDEVTDKVRRGKNLSQPNNCPRKMYQIMKDCWNMEPDERPTFTELHNILNEARSSVSSYSDDGSSCRSSSPAPSEECSEVSDDAFLEENSILNLKLEDSVV